MPKEGATIIVLWENDQKRNILGTLTERKRFLKEYKSQIQIIKFTNELQKSMHENTREIDGWQIQL